MRTTIHHIIESAVHHTRRAPRVLVCDSHGQTGYTQFDRRTKRVNEVCAPYGKGCWSRVIRVHELLHANLDIKPWKSRDALRNTEAYWSALQAAGDCAVHGVYWGRANLPESLYRDARAVAYLDLRNCAAGFAELKKDGTPPSYREWNLAVLAVLRAFAVCGNVTRCGQLVAKIFSSPPVANALANLANLASRATTRKLRIAAADEIVKLMQHPTPQPEVDEKGKLKSLVAPSSEEREQCPMRIVKLPLVRPSAPSVNKRVASSSGNAFNVRRLVAAVVSADTSTLFLQRRRLPGVSICCDASGSMNLDSGYFNEVCAALPASTIGYYAGCECGAYGENTYGTLAIYAQHGRRAESIERFGRGNSVDLWAIEWLLRQPAPRYLVTDLGFEGGPDEQEARAHLLLQSAMIAGQITLCHNLEALKTKLAERK